MVTLYIRDDVIGMNRVEELPIAPGSYWGMQLMEKLVPDPQFLDLWDFYQWDIAAAKPFGDPIPTTAWVIVSDPDAFFACNKANGPA